MTREVPARARQLASRLAALFESDSRIAVRLNDAQRRLRSANDQLWSGLRPDALGLVYDDAHQVAIGQGTSSIAGLQQIHWTIHRAFIDYQSAGEERRQLAVDVGELSQQLTEALCAAGWPEEAARGANVHELAAAGAG